MIINKHSPPLANPQYKLESYQFDMIFYGCSLANFICCEDFIRSTSGGWLAGWCLDGRTTAAPPELRANYTEHFVSHVISLEMFLVAIKGMQMNTDIDWIAFP